MCQHQTTLDTHSLPDITAHGSSRLSRTEFYNYRKYPGFIFSSVSLLTGGRIELANSAVFECNEFVILISEERRGEGQYNTVTVIGPR